MIWYALQRTTFKMQNIENAGKSWSFGEKGRKKKNPDKPKTFYEKY